MNEPLNITVGMSLADAKKALVTATLEAHRGNKRKTAEVLGITLKTLYNMLHRWSQQ